MHDTTLDPAKYIYESSKVYTNPESTYVVFDFETTNLDKGDPQNDNNEIVLSCWSVYRGGELLRRGSTWGNTFEQRELLEELRAADFAVAHNAKFELKWLKRMGVELRDLVCYCTMLGEWVLWGNLQRPKSLDYLGERYFGYKKINPVSNMLKRGVCPSTIYKPWLLKYCVRDVDITARLFRRQMGSLVARKQVHIAHIRNLTCSVIADIEFNGMHLDADRVREEYERLELEQAGAKMALMLLAPDVNFNSSKQLGEYIKDTLKFYIPPPWADKDFYTPTGQLSVSEENINKLEATTKDQELFLSTYRSYIKARNLMTKYAILFKTICEEHNGVLRAELNQNRTKTHRLSSTSFKIPVLNPDTGKRSLRGSQMQNIPREFKRLFCSGKEGWLIGEADEAQLEFRIAAELTRDPVAIEEIFNKVDVHLSTASVYFNKPKDQITSLERTDAKPSTFQPLFGGRGRTKQSQAYSDYFRHHYSVIDEQQKMWDKTVCARKYYRTPFGMIYMFPEARANRWGRSNVTNSIYNFPIQGSATAELMPIALICFWLRIRDHDIEVLNTVHDSIISRLAEYERSYYESSSRLSLTSDVFQVLKDLYAYDMVVPLGCEIKVATHWADTKEKLEYNVTPEGVEI